MGKPSTWTQTFLILSLKKGAGDKASHNLDRLAWVLQEIP